MSKLLKRIQLLTLLSLISVLLLPKSAQAAPTSLILITELKTGQGSAEFIEIENVSDAQINLSNWRLQYHSVGSTTWSNKTLTFVDPLVTLLDPGDRALLAATNNNPANSHPIANFPSGLADGGGAVRFVPIPSLDQTQGDILTWGAVDPPNCTIAPKHVDNQSLKRFPSGDGVIIDSSVSGQDFYVSNSPSPDLIDTQDPFSIDEVVNYCGKPEEILDDPEAPGTIEDPGAPPAPQFLKVEITELFPDPVTPQSDENDEYIELFNPNAEPVNLLGYKLQTGMNSTYSYTLGDVTIQPGEYYAISRKDSKLTLSNTSSKARILDPNGEVIDETDPYDQSNPAQSWQFYNGEWVWSSGPTPSTANIQISAFSSTANAAKVTAKPAAKATKAKAASTKRVSAKKAATTAQPKAAKKEESSSAFSYIDDQGNTKLQPYIIWGAGALFLGYGLWEYRHDLIGLTKRRQSSKN
jgi:hypothetical protein